MDGRQRGIEVGRENKLKGLKERAERILSTLKGRVPRELEV